MDINTLAELLLLSLYDLTEEQPHSFFFFQLDEVGARIGATDLEKMTKAVQILESRGFAMLSAGPWSAISAMISSDGIIFVENGGETGIIKAYRNNPQEITEIVSREVRGTAEPVSGFPQVDMPEKAQKPVPGETMEEILSRIGNILTNDPTITPLVREDAMRDLESLKVQLSRRLKNWRLIEMLLDALAEIPSLLPDLKDLAVILKNLD